MGHPEPGRFRKNAFPKPVCHLPGNGNCIKNSENLFVPALLFRFNSPGGQGTAGTKKLDTKNCDYGGNYYIISSFGMSLLKKLL
ncbi:MAG: hypothetical protein AB3K77_08550 [Methanosarcinaceae archaeon]